MSLDRAGMTEMEGGVTGESGDEEDLPFDMVIHEKTGVS